MAKQPYITHKTLIDGTLPPKTKKRKISVTMMTIFSFSVMVLIYYYFASFLVLLAGMAPTGLAYLMDMKRSKSMTRAIGAMNFSGTFYVLLQLWNGRNDMTMALDLMSDVGNWMIMFATAGIGYIIFLVIPPIVESYIQTSLQFKLRRNYDAKNALEEEWGKDIAMEAEMDTLALIEEEVAEREAQDKKNFERKQQRLEQERIAQEEFRKQNQTRKKITSKLFNSKL